MEIKLQKVRRGFSLHQPKQEFAMGVLWGSTRRGRETYRHGPAALAEPKSDHMGSGDISTPASRIRLGPQRG